MENVRLADLHFDSTVQHKYNSVLVTSTRESVTKFPSYKRFVGYKIPSLQNTQDMKFPSYKIPSYKILSYKIPKLRKFQIYKIPRSSAAFFPVFSAASRVLKIEIGPFKIKKETCWQYCLSLQIVM